MSGSPPARRRAEALELGAAEMAAFDDLGAAAGAPHRVGVERHGVFAGADQDFARPFGHRQLTCVSRRRSTRCSRRIFSSDRPRTGLGSIKL